LVWTQYFFHPIFFMAEFMTEFITELIAQAVLLQKVTEAERGGLRSGRARNSSAVRSIPVSNSE